MNVIGIIAEYNPFHNGHIYHINKIKEMYPNSIIILVMSGNFTQRGIPSIINKWDKAKIALNHNIDLVVELPYIYATQSADIFADGAIRILNELMAEKIVFGSEDNNIDTLIKLADIELDNKNYEEKVKAYLDSGLNYPTSMSKALFDLSGIYLKNSNDLLGLSYIKAIKKHRFNIEPISIKRTNDYLGLNLDGDIVSATGIRKALKDNIDIKKYVPYDTYQALLNEKIFLDDYFKLIKYKINTCKDLTVYLDVDEGIENRLIKYINSSSNIDEFINNVKTKRYTCNKIQRMLIHILCDFTKDDKLNYSDIPYVRVIGFNDVGRRYLNSVKQSVNIPIITKYIKDNKYLDLELRITKVYSLASNNSTNLIDREIACKPEKKNS